jgi:ketosteroid isomerase-like protein
MAYPSEDLVREAFAALGRSDIDALQRQYFAADICWHYPGRSPLAGDYEGVVQVVELRGRLSDLSGGTHRIELHDVIGNDEHVVALQTTRAERAGKQLEVNIVHVFHVRDGKVVEVWSHHGDLHSSDEFWS